MRNNIQKIRKNKGWSQQKLGDAIGVERAFVSKLEKGKAKLTQDYILAIAGALGCSTSDLISMDYKQTPSDVGRDAVEVTSQEAVNNSVDALRNLYRRSTPEVRRGFLASIKEEYDDNDNSNGDALKKRRVT